MVWWKKTAFVLANIGAINWGLATLDWDLIAKVFGEGTFANVLYWIVAICGIYGIVALFQE